MALQLTPDQEQRIQAIVSTGAYASAEEAINAAVLAVETAATVDFDGTSEELEGLLAAGLESPELSEEEFWASVDHETKLILNTRNPEPGP